MLIRRSNLMISATDAKSIQSAWQHDADAITLDLQDGIPRSSIETARDSLGQSIAHAGRGASDVFVRVNAEFLYSDIQAAVWPGLSGIVLHGVDSVRLVAEADEYLTEFERRRGVAVGAVEITLSVETAAGVWNPRHHRRQSPSETGWHRRSSPGRKPGDRTKHRPGSFRICPGTPLHRGHRCRRTTCCGG
jgi:citrate lyase beta subunit